MTEDLQDRIAQFVDADARLRETITEARQLLKDLRAVVKEAKELRSKLPTIADEQITQAVKTGLTELGDTIDKACETSEQAIMRRFGSLEAALFGDDAGDGKNLEQLVSKTTARMSLEERRLMAERRAKP